MACSPGLVTRADCFFSWMCTYQTLRGWVAGWRACSLGFLGWAQGLVAGVCLLVRVGGWLAGWWEGGWVARLLHTRV